MSKIVVCNIHEDLKGFDAMLKSLDNGYEIVAAIPWKRGTRVLLRPKTASLTERLLTRPLRFLGWEI